MRLLLVVLLVGVMPLGRLLAQTEVPVPPVAEPRATLMPLAQPGTAPLPDAAAPASIWRFSAEYLTWWIREGHIPAILTTSSPASQGILGRPDTQVLYGNQQLETRHQDRFVGARIGANWMDSSGEFGFEGRAFFLERDSTYYKAIDPNGSKQLALPYTDGATGQEASRVVSGVDPQRGRLSGGFVGYSRIEWFGEEANFVLPFVRGDGWQIDFLAGARFLQMRDRFEETATSRSYPDSAAHLYGLTDNYRVSDAFYGAQVGARGEVEFGRFFVQARGTVALGGDYQRIRTFGESIDQTPLYRLDTPVGLRIGANNTGDFSRVAVDGVGEVGLNVGYQLTRRLRVMAGYTFIAWFDPIRAGDQVNQVANRAGFAFNGAPLWVQGVSVGLEAKW